MTGLAIPDALDLLRDQLNEGAALEDMSVAVRTLQRFGMSRIDLVVFVERFRATNKDDDIDDLCLDLLDYINGDVPKGLRWDATELAASLVLRCLGDDDLRPGVGPAVEPSDMLPPRETPSSDAASLLEAFAVAASRTINSTDYLPSSAEFFRVPKAAFTTRRAALLALPDAVVLERLVDQIEPSVEDLLPQEVVWRRSRSQAPRIGDVAERTLGWGSPYIVKADIANYYDSVEHSLLAFVLVHELKASAMVARTIEAMLSAVMRLTRGLPQGALFSDTLASAYLLPVDKRLSAAQQQFVRYADDYYFPAHSMAEGRAILQRLEGMVSPLGLSLQSSKTKVMRRETFEAGLRRPSQAVVELKTKIAQERVDSLTSSDDPEEVEEMLRELSVDEELLWDLFYHGTISIEELIPQISDSITPSLEAAYGAFFAGIAKRLRSGERDEDFLALESLARECLGFLSIASASVDVHDLLVVQRWFPGVAPLAAHLMTRAEDEAATFADDFLTLFFQQPSEHDWVDAWMCHVIVKRGEASDSVREILNRVAGEADRGPLTRLEAVRALGAIGVSSERLWLSMFNSLSPAMKAEAVVASVGELDQQPWLRQYLRDSRASGLGFAAQTLLESVGESQAIGGGARET